MSPELQNEQFTQKLTSQQNFLINKSALFHYSLYALQKSLVPCGGDQGWPGHRGRVGEQGAAGQH